MTKKKALLLGYHGHANLGDDIFFSVISRWLVEEVKISSCYVQARIGSVLPATEGLTIVPFGRRRGKITRLEWLRIFLIALKADVVVFAAGSIFTVQPFLLIYCVLKILKAVKGEAVKIFAIGVSIGPFRSASDEMWCRKLLRLMDAITLREPWDLNKARNERQLESVSISYDLALEWCLRSNDLLRHRPTTGMLGVVVTERAFGNGRDKDTERLDVLCGALRQYLLMTPRSQVKILSVCSDGVDGDQALSKLLLARLGEFAERVSIVEYWPDARSVMISHLMECERLIASRMHAGVLAIFAGIPTLQVSYSPKIANFFIHSGITTVRVVDHEEISSADLLNFISEEISDELREIYRSAATILRNRASRVQEDLRFLAKSAGADSPAPARRMGRG